jgi:hypothetical protein
MSLKPNHSLSDTIKGMSNESDEAKNAAVLLGRRGGKKGGPSRAAALTKEQRVNIAKLGGKAAKRKKGTEGN